MKVMIVGGGGREHALAWKLAEEGTAGEIVCTPGNPGMAALGSCIPAEIDDIDTLFDIARRENPDLTVIGPELPAALGLADRLHAADLPVFGPSAAAARIESSKSFAKSLMARLAVPTARHEEFIDADKACAFLEQFSPPYVVKADGLASGKGVIIAEDRQEAETAIRSMLDGRFGDASRRILIEEFLKGEEASFFVACDGTRAVPIAGARDYKRVGFRGRGPNTGGIAAFSPSPALEAARSEQIMTTIVRPVLEGMADEGCPFRGVLYVGLMFEPKGGPKVLEFNARFGDPECQAVMMRMQGDLLPLLAACAGSGLDGQPSPRLHPGAAACLVMASGGYGYPGPNRIGFPIEGFEEAERSPHVQVFHAGTALENGRLIAAGGRVLGVTARGADTREALVRAYDAVRHIRWDGCYYRDDIDADI